MKQDIELIKNLRGVTASTGMVTLALALDTAVECMERIEQQNTQFSKDDVVESLQQTDSELKGTNNGK